MEQDSVMFELIPDSEINNEDSMVETNFADDLVSRIL